MESPRAAFPRIGISSRELTHVWVYKAPMQLIRGVLLARIRCPRTLIYSSRFNRIASMSVKLPPTISQGIVNFPGATAESKATAERLLEEDRQKNHCFWGKVGFHNHLSHQ